MVHRWLEEWCDTLLYVLILCSTLLFFLLYWKGECEVRYAEVVMQEFLSDVSKNGKITVEEHEKMVRNLANINTEYTVNIMCREFELQPVYGLVQEKKIKEYYLCRNIMEPKEILPCQIVIEEEPVESLHLQTETNASVLADVQNWMPLPEDKVEWSVESVRPYQEVYEGEELITVCRVRSLQESYYAEAEAMVADSSGTVQLQIMIEGEYYFVPVEVVCYPRVVRCKNGHEVTNSVAVLKESLQTGTVACPYCAFWPEKVQCERPLIYKKTGEALKKEENQITVTYLDGHKEVITPESEEWQDSYDNNYCGMQSVIVSYRGMEDCFTVISENERCRSCGKECNDRSYMDYLSFSYCTHCMSEVPLFSGEVYEAENVASVNEVLLALDTSGKWELQKGDFVVLQLSAKEKQLSLMQSKILQDGKSGDK